MVNETVMSRCGHAPAKTVCGVALLCHHALFSAHRIKQTDFWSRERFLCFLRMANDNISAADYKRLVEARFSNVAGTTFTETALVATSLVSAVVIGFAYRRILCQALALQPHEIARSIWVRLLLCAIDGAVLIGVGMLMITSTDFLESTVLRPILAVTSLVMGPMRDATTESTGDVVLSRMNAVDSAPSSNEAMDTEGQHITALKWIFVAGVAAFLSAVASLLPPGGGGAVDRFQHFVHSASSKSNDGVNRATSPSDQRRRSSNPSSPPRTSYFTNFRGSLMFLTMAAILAIDFNVFPRRFMKTETFGISLMDTGVGSFVFSAAIALGAKLRRAAAQHRRRNGGEHGHATMAAANTAAADTFSWQWLSSAVPLCVMGGARFLIIAVTQYQEHVTEYGTHWNFFLTLAMMPILYFALNTLLRPLARHQLLASDGVRGVAVLALYQAALLYAPFVADSGGSSSDGGASGLTAWIMSPHRRNFFEGNKEGILSSFGYLGMYLIGIEVGKGIDMEGEEEEEQPVSSSSPTGEKSARRNRSSSKSKWLVITVCATIATAVCETYVQSASRRMCNLTYVAFIVALNCASLLGFSVVESIFRKATATGDVPSTESPLLDAVNRNQLALFLVANLSTGAINLSMRTVFASDAVAYVVIGAYLVWVLTVAVVWSVVLRLRLKAW
jgi:phosphatidylinositol glycan class W